MKKILFSVVFSLAIAPAAFAGGGSDSSLMKEISSSMDEMPIEISVEETSCYEKNSYEFCDFETMIKNLEKDLDGIEADVADFSKESSDTEVQALVDLFIPNSYGMYQQYATIEVKRVVRTAKKLGMNEAQIAQAEKAATRFVEAKKSFLAKKSSLNILFPYEKDAIKSIENSKRNVKESMENIASFESEFAYDLTSDELRMVRRSVKIANRFEKKFSAVVKEAEAKIAAGELLKPNMDMWTIVQPVDNAMWKVQSAESNIESVIFGTHPVAMPLR